VWSLIAYGESTLAYLFTSVSCFVSEFVNLLGPSPFLKLFIFYLCISCLVDLLSGELVI